LFSRFLRRCLNSGSASFADGDLAWNKSCFHVFLHKVETSSYVCESLKKLLFCGPKCLAYGKQGATPPLLTEIQHFWSFNVIGARPLFFFTFDSSEFLAISSKAFLMPLRW
jgi:hypothetical protein